MKCFYEDLGGAFAPLSETATGYVLDVINKKVHSDYEKQILRIRVLRTQHTSVFFLPLANIYRVNSFPRNRNGLIQYERGSEESITNWRKGASNDGWG